MRVISDRIITLIPSLENNTDNNDKIDSYPYPHLTQKLLADSRLKLCASYPCP